MGASTPPRIGPDRPRRFVRVRHLDGTQFDHDYDLDLPRSAAGPALEEVGARRGSQLLTSALVGLGVFLVVTVVAILSGQLRSFDATTVVFLAVLLVLLVLVVLGGQPDQQRIVAGRHWVASSSDPSAVDLRHLTSVAVGHHPSTRLTALVLVQHKREVILETGLLEASPALWSLVYPGIVESVARGAKISDADRAALSLTA